MGFAMVNGAKLAWQQIGEGPDVVLVHGLATNRAFWFGHAMQLAAHFRVTLFDLRGHGYSDCPTEGFNVRQLGADILGLMDTLAIDRAAVIGHSYGGSAALEAAAAAPERFTALGLLDARSLLYQPQMWLHEAEALTPFEAAINARGSADGVDWGREPQVGLRFLEMAARHCVAGTVLGARDAVTPFGEGRGAQKAARQWLQVLETTDARDGLNQPGASLPVISALSMPRLLMYADESRCWKSGEGLARLWPDARFEAVLGAAHFFPLSHPAQVADTLSDFLNPLQMAEVPS